MANLWLIPLCVVLMLQASRACEDNNDEELAAARQQDSVNYFANAYGFAPNPWDSPYYYQPSRIQGYANPYEGRSPPNREQPNKNPFLKYFNKNNVDDESNQAEERFGLGNLGASLLNAGLFNNRFTGPAGLLKPFTSFANQLPISLNPNFASPIPTFDSCTSPSGESGICSPGSVCSLFGGRPSGSCLLGGVCCINAVTTCGGSITLNNTFWQSPTTAINAPSTCALTVKLSTKFVEQKKPICQVRLDLISFSIAQPATTGVCTDTFQVGGASNKVPIICGDNNGQHMYLEVPSSATKPTDLQLMFNFGSTTSTRSWNIKISMLPCRASYLAPSDCLQYFTASTGKVSSFNWIDVAVTGAATRQLANQDYNICFRTELINNQKANQICLSVCTPTNGGDAFSITTAANAANSDVGTGTAAAASCLRDFLLVAGGTATGNVAADRYCGNALNPAPAGAAASVQICTPIKPFRLTYKTDGTEAADAALVPPATADANNVGFCLTFTES